MSLYPKNETFALDHQLFGNPTAEYRGAPFWAWNGDLRAPELCWQIEQLKKMGMGGFHVHSRTGLTVPYMKEEFLSLVKAVNEKAKQENMLCWLYDEDRWPSGSAGGVVTKDYNNRARTLLLSGEERPGYCQNAADFQNILGQKGKPKGYLLARWGLEVKNGLLEACRLLFEGETAPDTLYGYVELAEPSPWYNGEAYADLLNPAVAARFIEETHEKYARLLEEDFGASIPAIFTDEPEYLPFAPLTNPQDRIARLPITDDFFQTYIAAYQSDLLPVLPEVLWDTKTPSPTRWRYFNHLADRFAAGFAKPVGDWCRGHGLLLTGHLMEEPTLQSQTRMAGEVMRSLQHFGLPGVDMLCDFRELTTVKQAQSVARQFACPGVMSELYGVTNWPFTFAQHKLQGDWQAALGVTVRVPHLSWYSMAGEAKRDYPASIHYQSPWYPQYAMVENHFARLNTALTRGKPVCRIGVIHPIESYWLCAGPQNTSADTRAALEEAFAATVETLTLGLLDFDLISEELLCNDAAEPGAPLRMGAMAYDAVIVPGCLTLRSETIARLEAFAKQGGKLLFLGQPAPYENAMPSPRAGLLAKKAVQLGFGKQELLSTLSAFRDVDIRLHDGSRASHFACQQRQDRTDRWLFIAPVYLAEKNPHAFDAADSGENCVISVKGQWSVTQYNTLTGAISPLNCLHKEGQTQFALTFFAHDSLLVLLAPSREIKEASFHQSFRRLPQTGEPLAGFSDITLSEPNVMLLDTAEFALGSEPYQGPEEMLRIDTQLRKRLQLPLRQAHSAQPWVMPALAGGAPQLRLRFTVRSDIPVQGALLVLEQAERASVRCNGKPVKSQPVSWFVDKHLPALALPPLPAGLTVLEVTLPFRQDTNLEWCYLLGNFGVEVSGAYKKLLALKTSLPFGDITHQGFPFYTGNLTYHQPLAIRQPGNYSLHIPHFANPLVGVQINNQPVGAAAFAPYLVPLGRLVPGVYHLGLTAFGNRNNAFGQLHNATAVSHWRGGPDTWRTNGIRFAYEYQLEKSGVLTTPVLYAE